MTEKIKQEFYNLIKDTLTYLKDEGHSLEKKEKKQSSSPPSLPHKKIAKSLFSSKKAPIKKIISSPVKETPKISKKEDEKAPLPPTKEKKTAIATKTPLLSEKKQSVSSVDLSEIKNTFQQICPHIEIIPTSPSDRRAKQISQRWKYKNQATEITLLSYQESKEEKAFLENICQALDIYFLPCRLVSAEPIEKENQWDFFLSSSRLKMIIASDFCIFSLNNLMACYKENPNKQEYTLNNTPLFLLPDISLYLKTPLLKTSLWKSFKQKLVKIAKT